MKYTLFDGVGHKSLLPLTYTKPVATLRVGFFSVAEKWERMLNEGTNIRTADYLGEKFENYSDGDSIGISATVLPTESLVEEIRDLKSNQLLISEGRLIAINPLPESGADMDKLLKGFDVLSSESEFKVIERPSDIFRFNGEELERDYQWLCKERKQAELSASNQVIGSNVFVEEGATVECAILNSSTGPIFIAKGAEVMEGTIIRGGCALHEGAVLKLGSKVYGPTTLGPYCKVGGEVNNVVFQGYSNKGHDGFLGNSVIGEWCNLGADTNTSNLKNNYGNVKVWSYQEEQLTDSGLQFCGLVMGDHAKCGINTMFNTGTVVGVNANVFGSGFPEKFIPSYFWGGAEGVQTYNLEKSFEVAEKVMARRGVELDDLDKAILRHVFNESDIYRK